MLNGSTNFLQLLNDATRQAISASKRKPAPADQQPLLNGMPYQSFRNWVSLDDRQRDGMFFTSQLIANDLANSLRSLVSEKALVIDPTCGMGDLLLAYAALLPVKSTLHHTIVSWGARLGGIELRSDLVRMAKARLILLARARGQFQESLQATKGYFPHISVGDMLQSKDKLALADGFLFNPPFGQTSDHCINGWGSGRLSAAAIFLDRLLAWRKRSAPIAAILPEVLRCGSRYEHFRRHIGSEGHDATYSLVGRFDAWTDVDVFTTLISTSRSPGNQRWTENSEITHRSVGDFFEIKVGPVVPHRHLHKGPWRRFICAKTVPAWSPAYTPQRNRRFLGTVYAPPFVVVRRTSSPSDKYRAVGAIITGENAVAVENHLIVLSPREGGAEMCAKLLGVLSNRRTSIFLNETIRCRHLTTSSVMTIPWDVDNE